MRREAEAADALGDMAAFVKLLSEYELGALDAAILTELGDRLGAENARKAHEAVMEIWLKRSLTKLDTKETVN